MFTVPGTEKQDVLDSVQSSLKYHCSQGNPIVKISCSFEVPSRLYGRFCTVYTQTIQMTTRYNTVWGVHRGGLWGTAPPERKKLKPSWTNSSVRTPLDTVNINHYLLLRLMWYTGYTAFKSDKKVQKISIDQYFQQFPCFLKLRNSCKDKYLNL